MSEGKAMLRALFLLTDAYGGYGGISRFNRDLIGALSAHEGFVGIDVYPRAIPGRIEEELPAKVYLSRGCVGSKLWYAASVVGALFSRRRPDLVICGHIYLAPLARLIGFLTRRPVVLIVHGIDAWQATASTVCNWAVRGMDSIVAVSEFTRDRFVSWTGISPSKCFVLPNCVDLGLFSPGPKNERLLQAHHLEGRSVLLTVGRLASKERYKGFDQVIELLPKLSQAIPNIVYLVVGDGDDRKRLQEKSRILGVDNRTIFVGRIDEDVKREYYRLADAYVMPSQGEGFGIVLLEAMACGIPVMASCLDGSQEAVRGGRLGVLVDPRDLSDVERGIHTVLNCSRTRPEGIEYFSVESFRGRVRELINNVMSSK